MVNEMKLKLFLKNEIVMKIIAKPEWQQKLTIITMASHIRH